MFSGIILKEIILNRYHYTYFYMIFIHSNNSPEGFFLSIRIQLSYPHSGKTGGRLHLSRPGTVEPVRLFRE